MNLSNAAAAAAAAALGQTIIAPPVPNPREFLSELGIDASFSSPLPLKLLASARASGRNTSAAGPGHSAGSGLGNADGDGDGAGPSRGLALGSSTAISDTSSRSFAGGHPGSSSLNTTRGHLAADGTFEPVSAEATWSTERIGSSFRLADSGATLVALSSYLQTALANHAFANGIHHIEVH